MAGKHRGDRIQELVKEIEGLLKGLRTSIRKRAAEAGLPKDLETAARKLKKLALDAVGQVEKYVHELRVDLEGTGKKPAKAATKAKAKSSARPKAAARPKATSKPKAGAPESA